MTARETPDLSVLKANLRALPAAGESPPVPSTDEPHETDLGNAKRLVERHGADLRYCRARGAWLVWDGRRWAWDESGEAERRAMETILSLYHEAADLPSAERKKLVHHAMRSEAASRIKAMLDLARSLDGVPVAMDALDREPLLLNVANGTLDLRSGVLRPHDRTDLMTRLIPTPYDPLAGCPVFLAYLDRILAGKTDLIAFLQRAIGYSLTGLTSERCLFILWGSGKNGKSTLLDTLFALLADHAARTSTDMLMASRDTGIPNDVARLKGMRFVFASEGEENRRLAEAKIKDLTGGDVVTARFMRGEWFDFRPEFKIWLGTNHKPVIRGTDDAIWDRIRLIPFAVCIPQAEQDKQLKAKLLAEAPGILAWAVEGCLAWQQDGLGEPEAVREATTQYRAEEDSVGQFLSDACTFGPGQHVTKQELYTAYKTWCEQNGEKPITQRRLSGLLKERNEIDEARIGREGTHYWIGVSINEFHEDETNTSGRRFRD